MDLPICCQFASVLISARGGRAPRIQARYIVLDAKIQINHMVFHRFARATPATGLTHTSKKRQRIYRRFMDALFDVGCCRGSFNVRTNNARAPNTKTHNIKASQTLGSSGHDGRKNKIAQAQKHNDAQARRNTYKQTHIYTNTNTKTRTRKHRDAETQPCTPTQTDTHTHTQTLRHRRKRKQETRVRTYRHRGADTRM